MIQFKALVVKELKEAFRDKRSLIVALSFSLLAPVLIAVLSQTTISDLTDNPPVYVNINGSENAPKLIKALQEQNIFSLNEAEGKDLQIWQQHNVQLVIPQSMGKDMSEGRTIELTLNADFNEKALRMPLTRIKKVVRDYGQSIAFHRLVLRGVDIKLLQPISLIEQDTSLPSSNAFIITMLLGTYLIMGAFVSGQAISIDTSAGERERNVLEILLCQPVSTLKIVLSKLLSSSSIAMLSVTLMLVLTTIAVGFIDLSKIGASFTLDTVTIVALIVLLIPLCLFAGALQLFFAFQAKTFKEAQSLVAMLTIVPIIIPVMLSFMDNKPQWVSWAPISGQSLVIEDLLKGLGVDWVQVIVLSCSTLAIASALVYVLAQRLKSEKVVMSLS